MGKPPQSFPAIYAAIYMILVEVGREHGYAMGLHGSMARDLDVIAVPWIEDAAPAERLVSAVAERLSAYSDADFGRAPGAKPHGRTAHNFVLSGGAFVDLSVMPRQKRDQADAGKSGGGE